MHSSLPVSLELITLRPLCFSSSSLSLPPMSGLTWHVDSDLPRYIPLEYGLLEQAAFVWRHGESRMTCIDSHRCFFVLMVSFLFRLFILLPLIFFRILSSPSPPTSDACISRVMRLGPWSSVPCFSCDWWGFHVFIFFIRGSGVLVWPVGLREVFCEVGGRRCMGCAWRDLWLCFAS